MCGLLLPLNIFRAVSAVFRVIGLRLVRTAADRASFCGFITEKLRFQGLSGFVLQKYVPEEFAEHGVRDALYAGAIKKNTDALIVVAANITYKGVRPYPLARRHLRQRAIPFSLGGRQVLDEVHWHFPVGGIWLSIFIFYRKEPRSLFFSGICILARCRR